MLASTQGLEQVVDGSFSRELAAVLAEGPQDPTQRLLWSPRVDRVTGNDFFSAVITNWKSRAESQHHTPTTFSFGLSLPMIPNPLFTAKQGDLDSIGTMLEPPLDATDPWLLGIHPTLASEPLDDLQLPAYIQRDVDPDLDAAFSDATDSKLDASSIVMVTGMKRSGKTRTLFEAVRRLGPSRRIFAVRPPIGDDRPLQRLGDTIDALGDSQDLVLWIDDADAHLGRGLTRQAMATLERELPGAIIAMSASNVGLERAQDRDAEDFLRRSRVVDLTSKLTNSEMERARRTHPQTDQDGHVLIAPEQVDRYLFTGSQSLGTALHTDLSPILADALGAGADLIVFAYEDPYHRGQPQPMRGVFLVLDDGRVTWTGACGPTFWSAPLNAFLADRGGDRRGSVEALLAGDEQLMSALDAWLPSYWETTATHTGV